MSIIMHKATEPSHGAATSANPVRVWSACPLFKRIRGSQQTRLVWDQEAPRAALGYPTILKEASVAQQIEHRLAKAVAAGATPAGSTISFPM